MDKEMHKMLDAWNAWVAWLLLMKYIKYNFENLDVYNLALDFVTEIYRITKDFPKDEMFGLTSQIRRAAVSIALNIVEGSGRNFGPDFKKFITYAISSLLEVKAGLIIFGRLEYLSRENFLATLPKMNELFFKLLKFRDSIK